MLAVLVAAFCYTLRRRRSESGPKSGAPVVALARLDFIEAGGIAPSPENMNSGEGDSGDSWMCALERATLDAVGAHAADQVLEMATMRSRLSPFQAESLSGGPASSGSAGGAQGEEVGEGASSGTEGGDAKSGEGESDPPLDGESSEGESDPLRASPAHRLPSHRLPAAARARRDNAPDSVYEGSMGMQGDAQTEGSARPGSLERVGDVTGSLYGAVAHLVLAQAGAGLASASDPRGMSSTQSVDGLSTSLMITRSRLLARPEHPFTGIRGTPGKRWGAFISHYKVEAAMEARFLQTELEVLLGTKCFLDSDDLRDLRFLQQSVRESDVLILVQSKSVLSRPYCLLELVTAIEARVPIVGVSLVVGSVDKYKFDAAPAFLTHLERTLEQANPGASSVLTRANVELSYASRLLAPTIPEVISIAFDPSASRNMLAASVADVASAMETAVPCRIHSPEEWLRQRAAVPVPGLDWNHEAPDPPGRTTPPSPTQSNAMRPRMWIPFRGKERTWTAANRQN